MKIQVEFGLQCHKNFSPKLLGCFSCENHDPKLPTRFSPMFSLLKKQNHVRKISIAHTIHTIASMICCCHYDHRRNAFHCAYNACAKNSMARFYFLCNFFKFSSSFLLLHFFIFSLCPSQTKTKLNQNNQKQQQMLVKIT